MTLDPHVGIEATTTVTKFPGWWTGGVRPPRAETGMPQADRFRNSWVRAPAERSKK